MGLYIIDSGLEKAESYEAVVVITLSSSKSLVIGQHRIHSLADAGYSERRKHKCHHGKQTNHQDLNSPRSGSQSFPLHSGVTIHSQLGKGLESDQVGSLLPR